MAVKSDKPELNLDEDLFDFPVMEMTVEGVREVKPEEIAAAVAAATAKPAAASSPSAPAAPLAALVLIWMVPCLIVVNPE